MDGKDRKSWFAKGRKTSGNENREKLGKLHSEKDVFDEIEMQLIKVLWEKPESFEANEISTFKEEFKTYLAIISPSKTWQRRKYNEED